MNATILDAGVGNLGNLARALRHLGAEATVTRDPAEVARGRCLLLPGVGAFAPPRENLRGELEDSLGQALDAGAWLLGICVGFQLLFETSEEFGDTEGLGLLPGKITRLPDSVPLPHIGWNQLELRQPTSPSPDLGRGGQGVRAHGLLRGLDSGDHVYFVHSFAPEGVPEEDTLATTLHGRWFPAVVGRGRILGTQFHPEKSGETGLKILANYLAMAHEAQEAQEAYEAGEEDGGDP